MLVACIFVCACTYVHTRTCTHSFVLCFIHPHLPQIHTRTRTHALSLSLSLSSTPLPPIHQPTHPRTHPLNHPPTHLQTRTHTRTRTHSAHTHTHTCTHTYTHRNTQDPRATQVMPQLEVGVVPTVHTVPEPAATPAAVVEETWISPQTPSLHLLKKECRRLHLSSTLPTHV